jgi:hypothetical protein
MTNADRIERNGEMGRDCNKCTLEWLNQKANDSLLYHLLCCGYDPEDYLIILDNIETAIQDREYLLVHPEEANEEALYLDDDITDWQEELKRMRYEWKPDKEPDMEEELALIKKWVKEREVSNECNRKV